MIVIVGCIIVLACVAGGYVLSHGNLMALWQPFELLIIGGAAFGGFVVSNPLPVIKKAFASIPALLKGSKFNKPMYMELLSVMYDLFNKMRKDGLMAVEADIEEPHESEIFAKYPKITADHHIMDFICDYLRFMVGGNMNAMELENLMDIELDTHHHELEEAGGAIQAVADALPGFGIVAAVLGIVITMASLGGPVEEIGAHVAAALVGTFLGILLAYGFVGPAAVAVNHMAADEGNFYVCMKTCILATLNGYAPQIAIEFGRKTIVSRCRPSFLELEDHVKNKDK